MKTAASEEAAPRDEGADGSTRARVLQAILAAGPRTTGELAEALGLTPAAVRRHLSALAEDGLITSREPYRRGPRGRGRPANVFVLTDAGREAFAKHYDDFALDLWRQLGEVGGPEALRRAAEARMAPVVADVAAARSADPSIDALDALLEALNANDYVASPEALPSGVQVCQHHCPVVRVAEAHPVLCEVETRIFADLLGSHVQRLATIAHGDGVCTTHVPHPLTPSTTGVA